MLQSKALYAGSFDPVTQGHLDIIRRAQRIFGSVTVLVMKNGTKKGLFPFKERVTLLRKAVADIPHVTVDCADGLLADYARKHQIKILVRGIRGISDLDAEFAQAHYNHSFNSSLETVFLPADEKLQYISSSIVREIARCGGDFSSLVPADVVRALRQKISR